MKNEKAKNIFKKLQPYALGLLLGLGLTAMLGLVAVSCSSHTTTPTATPLTITRKDALTPPTGYEYAYVYDPMYEGFLFTRVSDNSWRSVSYTQIVDGAYFNYVSNNVPDNAPFPFTLTFRHAQTFTDFGASGYQPAEMGKTYIGSDNTVGTIEKISFVFNNSTNRDYRLFSDFSSSGSITLSFNLTYKGVPYYSTSYWTTGLFDCVIPAYTSFVIYKTNVSSALYFDAFYLDDLGVSSAYTNGYNTGSSEGYADGYADGYSTGNYDGYNNGYATGSSEGYQNGFTAGSSEGYQNGFNDGSDYGFTQSTTSGGIVGFIGSAFDAVGSFMSIEVFEGITIGGLLLWPLLFGAIIFLVKLAKGGSD